MTSQSTDVQLALLNERMSRIMSSLDAHAVQLSEVKESLVGIEGRQKSVEDSLAVSAPTIAEFLAVKQKVIGAGTLGRYLWIGLGSFLGFVIASKETVLTWLTRGS